MMCHLHWRACLQPTCSKTPVGVSLPSPARSDALCFLHPLPSAATSAWQAVQQQQQVEKTRLLEGQITFNEVLIEERDVGIAEIQRQIGEVNEMFQVCVCVCWVGWGSSTE